MLICPHTGHPLISAWCCRPHVGRHFHLHERQVKHLVLLTSQATTSSGEARHSAHRFTGIRARDGDVLLLAACAQHAQVDHRSSCRWTCVDYASEASSPHHWRAACYFGNMCSRGSNPLKLVGAHGPKRSRRHITTLSSASLIAFSSTRGRLVCWSLPVPDGSKRSVGTGPRGGQPRDNRGTPSLPPVLGRRLPMMAL